MRRKQKNHFTAAVLAVAVLMGAMSWGLHLEASASNPGPPTYIPTEPSSGDDSWGPVEDETSSSQAGGQAGGQASSQAPSQSSQASSSTASQAPSQSQGQTDSPSRSEPASSSAASPSHSSSSSSAASSETVDSTSSGGVVAANFAELKAALAGSAERITLTANISMEEPIKLAAKRTVVLDGGGFRISEGAVGRTILAGNQSDITVRNAVIEGFDILGFVGAESGSDISIAFEGITYNGPQLCQNAAGGDSRIVIKDCDITLMARGDIISEELAQGSWVEFEGNTSVTQGSTRHPTFHLEVAGNQNNAYGGADRGVIVRKDAKVSIQAADYMLYGADSAFVVEEGAYFHYTAPDGGNYGTDNGFQWFEVGPKATFLFTQEGVNGHNKDRGLTMAVGGVLKMGRGSVFEAVVSDTTSGSPALDFRGGGSVQLSAPARVLISGSGGAVSAEGEKPTWSVNGVNALNYWDSAGGRYIWNDHTDGLTAFSFKLEGDSELSGTPESVRDLRGTSLTQSGIRFYGDGMQKLVIGVFEGALAVESWEGPVSGFASIGAGLTTAYYSEDGKAISPVAGKADGEEQEGGNSAFSLERPTSEAPPGAELGIVAERDGLLVQRASSAERVPGGGGAMASGDGTKITINTLEKVDNSVETTLRIEDGAARGWRLAVSDAGGEGSAHIITSYRVGEVNATRTDPITENATRIYDIPAGEQSAVVTTEVMLPAKADGSASPKTVCWTMILPVD